MPDHIYTQPRSQFDRPLRRVNSWLKMGIYTLSVGVWIWNKEEDLGFGTTILVCSGIMYLSTIAARAIQHEWTTHQELKALRGHRANVPPLS